MERILNFIGFERKHKRPPELPCLVRVTKDGIRLSLLEYQLPCGHSAYRVDLEYYVANHDQWIEIASLRDSNLEAAMELLQQAQQCITNLHAIP